MLIAFSFISSFSNILLQSFSVLHAFRSLLPLNIVSQGKVLHYCEPSDNE